MAPIPPPSRPPPGGGFPEFMGNWGKGGPTKRQIIEAMKKATRQALRITGATGGGVGGAPSTATFGVRQAGSTFARQSAHFLGRSAMGIGAGTAGSTVASVVIGVAAIIVAIAIIYYFWQQRQQAKNNPQKVQEINQEEQRALNDLREVEKDAMRRPFEYFPTPGRAG